MQDNSQWQDREEVVYSFIDRRLNSQGDSEVLLFAPEVSYYLNIVEFFLAHPLLVAHLLLCNRLCCMQLLIDNKLYLANI